MGVLESISLAVLLSGPVSGPALWRGCKKSHCLFPIPRICCTLQHQSSSSITGSRPALVLARLLIRATFHPGDREPAVACSWVNSTDGWSGSLIDRDNDHVSSSVIHLLAEPVNRGVSHRRADIRGLLERETEIRVFSSILAHEGD
jgi:hypothetical protein